MIKHISWDCKCKFDSATCNLNQKLNNDKCQSECKKRHMYEKDYSWNPGTCICENSKYLKSIANDSVIACNDVEIFIDSVSIKMTHTAPTNVTSTASINSDNKKVRYEMDCYILHSFLLVIILLFIIAIIFYHYAKHKSKQKDNGH